MAQRFKDCTAILGRGGGGGVAYGVRSEIIFNITYYEIPKTVVRMFKLDSVELKG